MRFWTKKYYFIFVSVFFIGFFVWSVFWIYLWKIQKKISLNQVSKKLTTKQIDQIYNSNDYKILKLVREIKLQKLQELIKKLRKKWYKNYYSEFKTNSWFIIQNSIYSNSNQNINYITLTELWNIQVDSKIIDYFLDKKFANISKNELKSLAFYLWLIKQYHNKTIFIKEKPQHKLQKYSLSCEANTLTDIINIFYTRYKIKLVDESQIINQIPLDKTKFYIKNWKYYWWNPEKGFVWNMNWISFRLDLKKSNKRWWWVYPKPLLQILNKYLNKVWYKSFEKNNLTSIDLISSIAIKNPIMFWYVYDNNNEILPVYNYWKKILLYKNQHVGVIVWLKIDNYWNIKWIYYYEWLHKNLQYMNRKSFLSKTKWMKKFIFFNKI